MTGLIILALIIIGLSLTPKKKLERMVIEVQSGQMDAVLESVNELGVEVETSYGNLLQVLISSKDIEKLEKHPGVIQIRKPMYPHQ